MAGAIFPTNVFSQRELDLASTEPELKTVEQIEEIVSRAGSNSPELIEPLTNLGLLYQAEGDHALAIAAFERAREVVRVNHGFFSSEETQLLRQLVRTEEARDNHARAWNWEQDLLTLVRQQPDALWTAPILREIAERKLDVLDHYLAGEFPPQIILGCYYSWPRHDVPGRDDRDQEDCQSGSRSDVVRAVISDAQTNYAEAVAVHLRNGDYAGFEPDVPPAGYRLHSSELVIHRSRLSRFPDILMYSPSYSSRNTKDSGKYRSHGGLR